MRSLIFIGVIFFTGSFFLMVKNLDKLKIEKYGTIVKMRIVSLPKSCIGNRIPYMVTFSYNGNIYSKQTRGDFCKTHYIGEYVDMKMLNGSEFILYPDESALTGEISFGILGLFGLFLAIFQWKKYNK